MANLDIALKNEFENLCELTAEERIKFPKMRHRIRSIREAIDEALKNGQSNKETAVLNSRLVFFNERVKHILMPEETTEEDPNENYVKKHFKGYVTRKIMLYLVNHINEEKNLEEVSETTGLTIRQLYDAKDGLVKKLVNEKHPFVLDTQRSKQGIYKLIEASWLDSKHKYTAEKIENCKTWISENFKGEIISHIMTILAKNLGKFISMEQIAKVFPNTPKKHLSAHISRLAVRLRKQNRLYLIEKTYGKYRLVENKHATELLKYSREFKDWANEVSQNDPIHKAAMACLSRNSLEQKTKIADLQNKIIKDHPSENAAELSKKIGNFIIKICGRLQNGKFRAVAEEGDIAICFSEKLLEKEAALENNLPDRAPMYMPLHSRGESIKTAIF